jgi:glycosyltransferase involved in cell wall biosynthesis
MRLLVISNTPFLPPTAGNRARIDTMLAYFADQGTPVAFTLLADGDMETWDVDGMRRRVDRLDLCLPDRATAPAPGRARRMLRAIGRVAAECASRLRPHPRAASAPIAVDTWCPPWFRARVVAVVESWQPDVLLVEYVFLSACLPAVATARHRPAVTVIDTHDVMHARATAYATAGIPLRWFHTTADEERRGLVRADVIVAIQEEDAEIFRRLAPGHSVLTVPHGLPVRPAGTDAAEAHRLLFVGSENALNVAALAWFFETVWPRLRTQVPAATLVVCGRVGEHVGALPPGVSAQTSGMDLAAEYARARIVINPVTGGTGLKIKTVEALCHGRPVVSTPAGARGLASGEAEGILVADGPVAFATIVADLLADAARWARLVVAATDHARRCYSPRAAFGPLRAELETRLAAGGAHPDPPGTPPAATTAPAGDGRLVTR